MIDGWHDIFQKIIKSNLDDEMKQFVINYFITYSDDAYKELMKHHNNKG